MMDGGKREVVAAGGTLTVSVDVGRRIGEALRRPGGIPVDGTFTLYRADAAVLRRYLGTRIVVDRTLPDGTAIWPDADGPEPFTP